MQFQTSIDLGYSEYILVVHLLILLPLFTETSKIKVKETFTSC